MSTSNYNLPTVNDTSSTFSFVDSVNGLATATDAALEQVREGFGSDTFDLPTASAETFGGVKVGSGFDVYADGEIFVPELQYKLPYATQNTPGGVVVGKNIDVTDEGAISVGIGAFGEILVDSENFANESVTADKINDGSITSAKMAASTLNTINGPQILFDNTVQQKLKVSFENSGVEFQVVHFANGLTFVYGISVRLYQGREQQPTTKTFSNYTPGTFKGRCNLVITPVKDYELLEPCHMIIDFDNGTIQLLNTLKVGSLQENTMPGIAFGV